MSNEDKQTEPSEASLEEIPEVDFSDAVRPNRYAKLRGDFEHTIAIDDELWQQFGSQERIIEALKLLVELAKRGAA